MKSLAERVAALSPQQRMLLERSLQKQREQQEDGSHAIPLRTGPGPWPACADQAALMFFQQVDDHAVPYNIGNGQRVFGALDHDLLEQAYKQLVQRQEMLRGSYPIIDGVTHVAVASSMDLPIYWEDVRRVPEDERERTAEKLAARHINQPFHMEKGPIVRFVVIQVADEEHLFIPVMHHSITDAISYNIFFRELLAIYWGLKTGQPAKLPPLTRQYVDYGLWRNGWLKSKQFEEQLDWWRKDLEGVPTIADLPTDYLRPPVTTYRGGRAFFELGSKTTNALRATNRHAGTTSLMTLLAGTYALLYRFAGLEDVVVAVPASHREHREMTHVIGYFLNYVPFRGRIRPGMTFTELLAAVKETVLGGLACKRVPFSSIVDAVKPIRDPGRMPLAQLGFVYVSSAGLNNEAAKLVDEKERPFRIEGYYADREISPMDLQFIFMEDADRVNCFLEFATDLFKADTMARLAKAFQVLFDACIAQPDTPLEQFCLLEAGEGRVLTSQQLPKPKALEETLHGRFETQAANLPNTIAVRSESQMLTYAQLQEKSDALAQALLAGHLKPETPVALALPPGPDFVAAVLGVMKAGGAFVPIDMDLPQNRCLAILKSSASQAVVTQSAQDLTGWNVPLVIGINDLEPNADEKPIPHPAVSSDQLACIVHTSGSTGTPKGVMVSHRNLIHRLNWFEQQLPAKPGEAFLQNSVLGVNEAIIEIFIALHGGGTLMVTPPQVRKDPAQLAEWIHSEKFRRFQVVPSLLRLLLTRPELDRELASLELAVLQGETLPIDVAEAFLRRFPNCKLVNNYGLTEATGVCYWTSKNPGELASLPGPTPTGHSLGGTVNYVLDRNLQPLPMGAVGELYVAGPALTRGYAGLPSQTGSRFIPSPFEDGARMYRTGDLARMDPVHGLTILGRADQQLKIRGNRVEPGEVEAALRNHPNVTDAVVVALNGELNAYVQTEHVIPSNNLRTHLAGQLPDYMVPAAFTCVETIPRTVGGKTDRALLSKMTKPTDSVHNTYVAPRNDTEKALATVWAQTLDQTRVGIDDDFYDLGGHSLKAAQIAALLHRDHGVHLSPALLFQARTIRQLAQKMDYIEKWQQEHTGDGPILLNESGNPKVFAFPPILGFAMVYRPLAQQLSHVSFYGFDFQAEPDPVAYYADHIENAQPEGPLVLMGYSAGGNLAFKVAQMLEARGRQVKQLILVDSFFHSRSELSEQEVHEKRNTFLAELEQELRNDPVMSAFARERYLRSLIRKVPNAFFQYHYANLDQGTVTAPIVFVEAGEPDDERMALRQAWQTATLSGLKRFSGAGPHQGMFEGENLQKTAEVLRQVLKI